MAGTVFCLGPLTTLAVDVPESSPASPRSKSTRRPSAKLPAENRVDIRDTVAEQPVAQQPVVTQSQEETEQDLIRRRKARIAARKREELLRRKNAEAVDSLSKKARRRPVVPVSFNEQALTGDFKISDVPEKTDVGSLEASPAEPTSAVEVMDDTTEVPELPADTAEISTAEISTVQPSADGESLLSQEEEPVATSNTESPTLSRPRRLKKLSAIQPFADYEPFPNAQGTPSNNQCPCPEGEQCECPVEVRFHEGAFERRNFAGYTHTWEASNLYHIPLYFEDAGLERYGHSRHPLIQPFFSVGLMGVQLVGLPYQMTIDPVAKRRYTLGWYRPGQYVTPMYYQIPLNAEAFAVQAATVTGGYFVFPP